VGGLGKDRCSVGYFICLFEFHACIFIHLLLIRPLIARPNEAGIPRSDPHLTRTSAATERMGMEGSGIAVFYGSELRSMARISIDPKQLGRAANFDVKYAASDYCGLFEDLMVSYNLAMLYDSTDLTWFLTARMSIRLSWKHLGRLIPIMAISTPWVTLSKQDSVRPCLSKSMFQLGSCIFFMTLTISYKEAAEVRLRYGLTGHYNDYQVPFQLKSDIVWALRNDAKYNS